MQPDLRRMANNPAVFREHVLIEHADGSVVRLGSVLEDWQRRDFAALDPALLHVAGRGPRPRAMRFLWERSRGHSKTSDAALNWLWLLLFARRPVQIVIAAADVDQAKVVRNSLRRIVQLNDWLASVVTVQSMRVINESKSHRACGAELLIISSSAPTSYGLNPHAVHCDELTVWSDEAGQELFHSLYSSSAKRPGALFQITQNAGTGRGRSWQWAVRETARTSAESESPSWVFSSQPGPVASWITADTLAEQKRILPSQVFARLWGNVWASDNGNAIDPEDLKASLQLAGPQFTADDERIYVTGVDASTRRDATAICTLSVDGAKQVIDLAECQVWRPRKGHEVELEGVLQFIRSVHRRFRPREVRFDPFQMQFISQILRRDNVPMKEIFFSNAALDRMASAVVESFKGRTIRLYPEADLIRDLERMELQDLGTRWRLVHPRDRLGHGDLGTAFSLAIDGAVDFLRYGNYEAPSLIDRGRPQTLGYGIQAGLSCPNLRISRNGVFLAGSRRRNPWLN